MVAYLAAAYPSFQIPAETTKVYAEALSGMSDLRLKTAARDCVKTCKFFPTVAELNEAGQRVRIESQHKELPPGAWLVLRPPDPRLCPKCKGMKWLYRPKPHRPEWDVELVPCDTCGTTVKMNEDKPRSWKES